MQHRRTLAHAPVPLTTTIAQRKPAPVQNPTIRQNSSLMMLSRYAGNGYLQRSLAQNSGSPTLRMGSSGAGVRNLQNLLNQNGASLNVDGIFGQATRDALIQFQQARGLSPDGIAGAQTWGMLGGGQNANAANGTANPAGTLIKAKLQEIQQYMTRLSHSAPDEEKVMTGTADPVEMQSVHNHDSWWDEMKGAASDAYDDATNAASETWDDVKGAAGEVVNDAGEAWDDLKSGAGEVWNDVKTGAGEVVSGAGEAWNDVKTGVGGAVNSAGEVWNDVTTGVGEGLDEIADEIKQEFASEIAAVQEFVNDIQHYIENPDDALRKLEEILNGLKKKAEDLLGGDEQKDQQEVMTGTADPVEMTAGVVTCHDRPATRQLRFSLGHEAKQTEGAVSGDVINHDSVRGTISHGSVKTTGDSEIAAVPADDFGTTGSKIKVTPGVWEAGWFKDYVTVPLSLMHNISSDVTNATKQINVGPDLNNIEETIFVMQTGASFKWSEAADDLDPDVAKVGFGSPRRKNFWAKDITWGHEKFHASDSETHLKDKIMPELEKELNSRTIDVPWIWGDDEVKSQVFKIAGDLAKMATRLLNEYMAKPAVENRAYANDEPAYRERAKAIRDKAKTNGWK